MQRTRGRPQEIENARAFYAAGLTLDKVARGIGRNSHSVMRWRARDAGTAFDWDVLRDGSRASCPAAIVAVLEKRIVRTAEDDTLSPGARAFEIRQLHAVLMAERAHMAAMLAEAGQEDGADAGV